MEYNNFIKKIDRESLFKDFEDSDIWLFVAYLDKYGDFFNSNEIDKSEDNGFGYFGDVGPVG